MSKHFSSDRLIAKCNSWEDFSTALLPLTNNQKGDCFERLTQLYLLTKPEYQTVLKDVWICSGGSGKIPKRVRTTLSHLPTTTDEGIDLVAETRNGEFWSIQCKYKTDTEKALTYKELSTFTNLTFNVCAGHFAKAFVVHTSSKPVRKRKLLGNTTEIGLQRWLETTAENWKGIHGLLKNKPVRPKRYSPRPHQKKAIKSAKKYFFRDEQSRGKLIMPCGTGKSLTAYWIAQALDAKTILVVVPSLALIKQGVEDWTREIAAENETPLPEWLCVCSDESVGSIAKDDFVSEVYDLGLPVTTNPVEIQQFLKKRSRNRRIVFVTYQSSPVFAKVARKVNANFDLAILDEAHKTAGEKTKEFATLLFDKNLKVKNRIFMTATERVMRGSHDEVVSMDNKDVYGDSFYQLSFKEAIHSEPAIICDYKILTVFVTEGEIKSVIEDKRFVKEHNRDIDTQDASELAAAIALRKAYKSIGIKHTVSFHRSIQSASKFSDQQERLNELRSLRPRIESFHISSKKTAGQRTQLLKDFAESSRSMISNARCLTEGVDVPAIDCVLFADPKQSTIDIVQAAGRALRPFEGKSFGYIMLPIVVPDGMEFDEFAETTAFRTVSKVITALSTQDERIAEEFRVVDRSKKRKEGIIQFEGSIPAGMNIDLHEFADAISAKIWERVAKINWRVFEEARQFVQSLKLKSQTEWFKFTKSGDLPDDIPVKPNRTYEDKGWSTWGDWLGTETIASQLREYRTFKKARQFAHNLQLKSATEWREFVKTGELPEDMPSKPDNTYRDKSWTNWGDWLGTGNISNSLRDYRTFKEARQFARRLKLSSQMEWFKFTKSEKLPKNIPTNPSVIYKDEGWDNYGDWLGTGTTATRLREYRTFTMARQFAHSLKLNSEHNWREFTKSGNLPNDIPTAPERVYKGWVSMGDWLGTGTVAARLREYRTFTNARQFAQSLKLKSTKEWREFTKSGKLPKDIPVTPNIVYKDKGWVGMGDWLGTGNTSNRLREFRTFTDARQFAQSLNLKSTKEWFKLSKSGSLPKDIPSNPNRFYRDKGWVSMGDWLGTGNVSSHLREYRTFTEARQFARSLKLSSQTEWFKFTKSVHLPKDIPSKPNRTYNDKGWVDWGNWLGK